MNFPIIMIIKYHPQLLFDFEQHLISKKLDANALTSFWAQARHKLRTVFATQPKYAVTSMWDEEVEDLLIFLKVFYVLAKKKQKPFKDVIDKLIIFKVVSFSEPQCWSAIIH